VALEESRWVDEFLVRLTVERGRALNTVGAYRRDLSLWSLHLAGRGVSLASARDVDVESFAAALRQNGLAKSTVARRMAAVRGLHAHLVAEGRMSVNPAERFEGISVPAGIPHPLDHEEIEGLLSVPAGTDPRQVRDRALLEFLYATGARISEACGLGVDDVDFSEDLVRLFGKGSKEDEVAHWGKEVGRINLAIASSRPPLSQVQSAQAQVANAESALTRLREKARWLRRSW
jgi:integrase/recombinase XerD